MSLCRQAPLEDTMRGFHCCRTAKNTACAISAPTDKYHRRRYFTGISWKDCCNSDADVFVDWAHIEKGLLLVALEDALLEIRVRRRIGLAIIGGDWGADVFDVVTGFDSWYLVTNRCFVWAKYDDWGAGADRPPFTLMAVSTAAKVTNIGHKASRMAAETA